MSKSSASTVAFTQSLQNIQGGISYRSPSFIGGSSDINGGFNFDLPLATVASFNNAALSYTQANSQNAQGFLSGVIGRGQSNMAGYVDRAYQYNASALQTTAEMHNQTMNTARYIARKGGFGGCFITTAVCHSEGKPDDCAELKTLRAFRDNWLAKHCDGKEAIERYYRIAPEIVRKIDRQRSPEIVYAFLRDQYINHALAQIEVGDMEGAFRTYSKMVRVAQVIAGVKDE